MRARDMDKLAAQVREVIRRCMTRARKVPDAIVILSDERSE